MSNSLAVVNKYDIVPISSINQDDLEGFTPSFTRVKIPSGGGLAFALPSDDPKKPEVATEIVGVIVDHYPVNAYWSAKYSGEKNPPDCSSMDGKHGKGSPGGNCKECPFNQWGSDVDRDGNPSNGKACKNMHRLYILREGEMFPLLLTLPPTSLKNRNDYWQRQILGKGRPSYGVITQITLHTERNKGGIDYSQTDFAVAGVLSPEVTKQVADFAARLKPITRNIAIEDDEFGANDEAGIEENPY